MRLEGVIDEPVAPPPRRRRGRIEIATAGLFVALISALVFTVPPLREAVTGRVRATWDDVFSVTWAGYYLEIDQTDPNAAEDPEQAASQLMFASGSLPGSVARLLEEHVYSGTWSPSGERFVVSSGTRLFIGDRHGQVHLLTDLRDRLPTAPALWASDHELVVASTPDGQRQLLVHVDPSTGSVLDERSMPADIQPYAPSPDGHWLLAVQRRGQVGVLFEPATGRVVMPKEREAFAAWLGDGRIVVSVVDSEGAHLVARKPEGGTDQVLVDLDGIPLLPATSNGGRIAFVEEQTAEVSGPRSIWLIAPGEAPVRVAKDLGAVYLPKASRDGRFVSFSEISTLSSGDIKVRTGLIEIATKKVSYACDEGCAVLDLR